MTLLDLILIALALAVDAFSVGVGVALTHRSPRQIFRLSYHFGLFQALMALLGMLAGSLLFSAVKHVDHWVAFALLTWLGLHMLRSGGERWRRGERADLTRGLSLIVLSLAVSIDAAAVGVGLAAEAAPRALAVGLIGLVSALATLLAFGLAGPLGARVGQHGEKVAGTVLILLGIKILVEHLG
jgi:putative Mn2+ efflux pump MntP